LEKGLDSHPLEPRFGDVKELLHALVGERLRASARALSLAVLYEDNDTHEQATAVYELLLSELDENACVTATWWRTSLVGDPKLSRLAAHAIGASDLIFVSVHADGGPSTALKWWMDFWPIDSDCPPRMIGLFYGRIAASEGDWDRYLRDLAQCRNMPYLAGSLAGVSGTRMETIPDEALVEPYVHGGLNE
jgi:hypothetical protein